MSVYPGNASLAAAVKDRVLSTFEQTLTLLKQGRTDEVLAGCNLILQMDPLFDPARKLLEKARDPGTPVDMSSFMGGGGDPLAEARQAMAARDFERVVQITTEILTNDLMNDDARVLSDAAREKIEAAPFVDQFVRKCQQHIQAGNIPAAKADLEKARALDPNHPGIAQIETMIRQAGAPAPAAPAAASTSGFDSSSFVVDTPSGSGRGTAQASDFGFTFEEEKGSAAPSGFDSFSFGAPEPAAPPAAAPPETPSGAFSFDSPVDTPASPAGSAFTFDAPAAKPGAEFDFSTASIETSPDDQKKIDQYLADGDRAFTAADYQQAIDLWSRIFLIDVTNEAASERIEKAKFKRREIEQRLEGVLNAGVQAFEKKDFTTARAKFEEVLQGDPSNVQAQDYMERMSEADAGASFIPPSAPATSFDDTFDEGAIGGAPMMPPDPVAAPAAPAKKTAGAKTSSASAGKKKLPVVAIAAVIGLLVVGAAGWFAMSRMGGDSAQSPAASQALVTRASSLGSQGKFDEAIAILKEIQPGDGQYDAALAMIADLQQKKARASTTIDGRPAAAFFDESIAAGRAAFAAHDYVGAKTAFENAQRAKPLPPDVKPLYDTATQQVAKLATARALFNERRYSDVINSLEPLRLQDPQNTNIQRMMIDAHFNLGAQALQQDRLADAIREFDAVLKEDPTDELARRSKELAERYEGQPRDLLYRIYVKYLPLRQAAG
jgi:tetratricopeptide (TPR) repeat protein